MISILCELIQFRDVTFALQQSDSFLSTCNRKLRNTSEEGNLMIFHFKDYKQHENNHHKGNPIPHDPVLLLKHWSLT